MALDPRITSRRHPLVARLRAAARREGGDVLLDGPHLLDEALRSDARAGAGRCTLLAVVVTQAALERAEIARSCDAAASAGVPVHIVPDALADAISPARSPTGVVALAEVRPGDLDEVVAGVAPLLVVLAGVQDPGNVGTIVRTTEAAGASGVVLLSGTADPLGWKALRGSMGSALRVPVHRAPDTSDVLSALRARGLQLVAAESTPTGRVGSQDLRRPTALIVGAEGQGLPAAVAAGADAVVRIPLEARVESLNVAVATALLLFEARRQRTGTGVLA
jgi:TrmH family RNA methyltransferase